MGTRSLTKVFDEDNELLVTIYRQMDGYPSGHGRKLTGFLKNIRVVSGIPLVHDGKIANGMGCLAAQIIAYLKDGPGSIYIVNPGDHGQEYVYEVYADKLVIKDPRKVIFSGTWEEAYEFCKTAD